MSAIWPQDQGRSKATNALTTFTIPSVTDKRLQVVSLDAGYDRPPAVNSRFLIKSNSAIIFELPITTAGPQVINAQGLAGFTGHSLVFELADGGAGVTGYINAVVRII